MAYAMFDKHKVLCFAMLYLAIQHYIQHPTQHVESFLHVFVVVSCNHITGHKVGNRNLRYWTITLAGRQQNPLQSDFMAGCNRNNIIKCLFHCSPQLPFLFKIQRIVIHPRILVITTYYMVITTSNKYVEVVVKVNSGNA